MKPTTQPAKKATVTIALPPVAAAAPAAPVGKIEIPAAAPVEEKKSPGRPAAKRTLASAQVVIPAAQLPALLAEVPLLGNVVLTGAPIYMEEKEKEAVKSAFQGMGIPVPQNIAEAFEEPKGFETISVSDLAARGGSDAKIGISDIRAFVNEIAKKAFETAQKFDPEVMASAAEEAKLTNPAAPAAAAPAAPADVM